MNFGHWEVNVCRLLPRYGASADSGRRKRPADIDCYECVQKVRGMGTRSCPPALGLYVLVKKVSKFGRSCGMKVTKFERYSIAEVVKSFSSD